MIVTDLKQWAYCPRIVYYRRVMPGVGKPTFKMEEAKSAQELIERLELRRGLGEYGMESARRHFGVWLTDAALGLAGKVDLVLEGERSAAVVDFKLTSGEPGENHRLQLAGYAMLVEVAFKRPVKVAFLYRIPDDRLFAIRIDEVLRAHVRAALRGIQELSRRQLFPEPTRYEGGVQSASMRIIARTSGKSADWRHLGTKRRSAKFGGLLCRASRYRIKQFTSGRARLPDEKGTEINTKSYKGAPHDRRRARLPDEKGTEMSSIEPASGNASLPRAAPR